MSSGCFYDDHVSLVQQDKDFAGDDDPRSRGLWAENLNTLYQLIRAFYRATVLAARGV